MGLENGRVRVVIWPDDGGKVVSIVHKDAGREVLYGPGVIKPVRVLPRFAFVPGGIAASFPISHSPTQNEPVLVRIDRTPPRLYVTCGERELRFGMHCLGHHSLLPGHHFLPHPPALPTPHRPP